MPILFAANALLFLGLIGWMLLAHCSSPGELAVVEVPARAEPRSSGTPHAALEAAPDSLQELQVEPETASALDPLHSRAREAFRSGDVDGAIRLLSSLVEEHPDDAALLNDLGVYHLSKGHLATAEAIFVEATRRGPSYPRALYNLGTARLRGGDFDGAASSLGAALELNPYYAEARYNRALARAQLGDLLGAEEDYRFVAENHRSETAARADYNLALLLARQGRLHDALASLRRALRIRPGHVETRFNTALLLSRSGLNEEAVSEYRKLLALEPDHRRALLNLGALLMRRESWKEAADLFDRLIEIDPSSSAAHYNLGLCFVRLKDDSRAAQKFRDAIAQDSAYAEAHYNLGLALKRMGDPEGAVRHFERAVELRREEPAYRYNLALTLANAGRPRDAMEQYGAAATLEPDYFPAIYNLAVTQYREGDYASALASFERATRLDPESYVAKYNLGLALLKLGRLEEAERALREALEFGDTVEARYNLGLAAARQGRLEEAAEEYRAALRLDPKHVRSTERLAETLAALGDHERALERLALLQKLDPADPTAYNLGVGRVRARHYDMALRYFAVSTLGADPLRRKSQSMKGLVLARLGHIDEAVSAYREALLEAPGDAPLRRNLARALSRKGDHAGAAAELERARAADPGDARTLYLLGRQYEALDRREEAANRYRGALALAPDYRRARRALGRLGSRLQ